MRTKVTLYYDDAALSGDTYRIAKIVGAAVVKIRKPDGAFITGRVGDCITEAQAVDLAQRTEVTVIPEPR